MAVQSSAGRPVVGVWVRVARPARASVSRARWIAWVGWLCCRVSEIWVRVRPAGWFARAAWICSARGSPLASFSAQLAQRAA